MNRLQKWIYGNWSVPVVSGVLIVISFAIQWLGGGVANITIGPQWWVDAAPTPPTPPGPSPSETSSCWLPPWWPATGSW
ncbi:hypothetical protein [Saccharomonospora sp. CUA-673]|uniref:hypothetical protein n=1 Tax=Saccharomonospora sp. CUA-673 TaxID=1904969 RepID=UPI001C9E1E34|nr:hypothetical protein [Saccharomonospora sp. CUA-673]